MQSKAATVKEYLATLPPDRRPAIEAVRKVILQNLDPLYQEGMSYGMIGYSVPHAVFPAGYHCDPRQPLPFAGLASQKNYMSLYLMGVYCGCDGGGETAHARWFHEAWARTGKKLDMGKACIRFRKLEDLPLEVIGEAIRRVPVKLYVQQYEKTLGELRATKKATGKAATKGSSEPGKSGAKPAATPATKVAGRAQASASVRAKRATAAKPAAATRSVGKKQSRPA